MTYFRQFDTIELMQDINPVLTKGMRGIVLEVYDGSNCELEFVKDDGSNYEYDGKFTFTIPSSLFRRVDNGVTIVVSEQLQRFINLMGCNYHFPLTANLGLQENLGIYGDDVSEFFEAFSKEFNVDVSQFMAADYFNGEGIDFIGIIVNLFKSKPKRKKTLTLGHLDKAILAGRLDESVINS